MQNITSIDALVLLFWNLFKPTADLSMQHTRLRLGTIGGTLVTLKPLDLVEHCAIQNGNFNEFNLTPFPYPHQKAIYIYTKLYL